MCVCVHTHTVSNTYTRASAVSPLPATQVSRHLPPARPVQAHSHDRPVQVLMSLLGTHSGLKSSCITYCCKPLACTNSFTAQNSPPVSHAMMTVLPSPFDSHRETVNTLPKVSPPEGGCWAPEFKLMSPALDHVSDFASVTPYGGLP